MSASARYHAPFAEGGSSPVDAALIQRLLSAALDRGGDYADLFFEYVVSGSYALEEGILKSASRAVSMGLGVRVLSGDATGFAYVQELTPEAMLHAARTAAAIAQSGAHVAPVAVQASRGGATRYEPKEPTLDVAGEQKRALL